MSYDLTFKCRIWDADTRLFPETLELKYNNSSLRKGQEVSRPAQLTQSLLLLTFCTAFSHIKAKLSIPYCYGRTCFTEDLGFIGYTFDHQHCLTISCAQFQQPMGKSL